jgi:hypothetical protein
MSKTMMPLLKRASTDGDLTISTKHSADAMILNGTGIKVESDATTRVDDLTIRKELHVKLRNMRNRRNMK